MAGNSKACFTVISYEENLKFYGTTVQKEIEFWQSQNVSGIAVGLHHREVDDKNHEHWMMGYSKSAPTCSDFINVIKARNAELQEAARKDGKDISIVLESGEVVDRALYKIYSGRYAKKHCVYDPEALEDYLSHSTAKAKKENKVEYDPDKDVIYSDGFDLDSYLSRDALAKAKAESRDDDVDVFSEITDIINVRHIRHLPDLVLYLKKKNLRSLLKFCIAHPTIVTTYISDMRQFVIGDFPPKHTQEECEEMYLDGTNSEDEKPYKPESKPVKMTYSESQAVLARSTDEIFGGPSAEASPSDEPSAEPAPASAEPASEPAEQGSDPRSTSTEGGKTSRPVDPCTDVPGDDASRPVDSCTDVPNTLVQTLSEEEFEEFDPNEYVTPFDD